MNSSCTHGQTNPKAVLLASGAVILAFSFTAGILGTVGCGSANKLGRLAVSGNVTLDGKPLDYGSIDFYPEGSSGVSAGGMLSEDGSYSIPELKGLPSGSYVVRIYSAFDRVKAKEVSLQGPDSADNTVYTERIPEDFNTESKQVVVITQAGPNTFNFDIETKK